MPAGRPTDYTPDLGDLICDRLSNGESLNRICQDEDMPWRSTVIRWALGQTEDAKEFCDKYAHARQVQSELLADEIHDISDGSGDVQRDKLRVDTRKWYLSSIVPRFKPKSETTHGITNEFAQFLKDVDGKDTGLPDGDKG